MRGYFNNSQTGKPIPNFPEVSGLRTKFSERETDSPNRVHYKQDVHSAQINSILITIRGIISTLNRLRIHSRGGSNSSSTNALKGEYSATIDGAGGYITGNIVVVSTGDNQGTYGYINSNASSGAASPWVGGGYWIQLPGGLQSQWM